MRPDSVRKFNCLYVENTFSLQIFNQNPQTQPKQTPKTAKTISNMEPKIQLNYLRFHYSFLQQHNAASSGIPFFNNTMQLHQVLLEDKIIALQVILLFPYSPILLFFYFPILLISYSPIALWLVQLLSALQVIPDEAALYC